MHTPPAVRTADEPMAFTGKEFARGAFAAWVIFICALFCTLIVSGILESGDPWGPPSSVIFVYLIYGIPIGGAVSALVTIVLSPVAWAVGRALRRQSKMSMHIAAYLVLGAAIGSLLVVGSAVLSRADTATVAGSWFAWYAAAVCAASVAGGWGYTVRRAISERDRRLARMRPQ